jgi:hypothetical protein
MVAFARTVGADKAEHLAGFDFEIEAAPQGSRRSPTEINELDHLRAHLWAAARAAWGLAERCLGEARRGPFSSSSSGSTVVFGDIPVA